jgi:hypothetical protein
MPLYALFAPGLALVWVGYLAWRFPLHQRYRR